LANKWASLYRVVKMTRNSICIKKSCINIYIGRSIGCSTTTRLRLRLCSFNCTIFTITHVVHIDIIECVYRTVRCICNAGDIISRVLGSNSTIIRTAAGVAYFLLVL
jgi:hypothetical protein